MNYKKVYTETNHFEILECQNKWKIPKAPRENKPGHIKMKETQTNVNLTSVILNSKGSGDMLSKFWEKNYLQRYFQDTKSSSQSGWVKNKGIYRN